MEPGITWYDVLGVLGADVLAGLLMLTGWLGPRARQPKRVPVPDVRGLFYDVCLEVTGRLGLHFKTVRLTSHPMPVDGLVVDQSPRAPGKLQRGGVLTVQVWHPPARSR
jgi:beta-lactam-binding protein with PASTA domain